MAKQKFHGRKIQFLYIDGGEIDEKTLKDELSLDGTTVHVNTRSSHTQNPFAERGIQTIENVRKTALIAVNTPKECWEFPVA